MSEGSARQVLVLIGLPGAGKTRVGRALAARLGVSHVDTDDLIVQDAGMPVAKIFAEHGEKDFRRREVLAVREALNTARVVSLGGGALESPDVQQLVSDATVIYIAAEHEELLRRVKRNSKRPLLQNDPDRKLRDLADLRGPTYRSAADITVTTSAGPLSSVVNQILEQLSIEEVISVGAQPPYDVTVGQGVLAGALRAANLKGSKVLLLAAPHVSADQVVEQLQQQGQTVTVSVLPDGESAKTMQTAQQLWELAGELRLGRSDCIITVGGGATTDLGGFIAATWLRGIKLLHVPTTVLAMVDAAVGGKTGINSPAGKNLIGSFYNPQAVIADLDWFGTLPQRQYTAGLAEVIKCGFIADPEILKLIENNPQIADQHWGIGEGKPILHQLIVRAIRVKAEVVEQDFRESGLREILNYGHTLAHAIEKDSHYSVQHGEAVAVGMILAAEIAAASGQLSEEQVRRHRDILSAIGLPSSYSGDVDTLIGIMRSDKKTRGDQLRFVLLQDGGDAATYPVSESDVREAAGRVIR